MFVVPCRFDPARPIIAECVRRIFAHHPDADVLVVDSKSEDHSYFGEVEALGAQVADIGNRHYATGAHRYAYEHCSADSFALVADSIWLNAPLPDPAPLTTIRWFSSARHGWGWDAAGVPLEVWGGLQLNRMGIPAPDSYNGILGPYLICQRPVLDALAEVDYFGCEPADKYQQCGMERICGIVLEHLGFDVTRSIQGEHCGHWDAYPEQVVTKLEMARM